MPEGDTIRMAAAKLKALEGQVLSVEAPNPRAKALGVASKVDGLCLERVEARGKNILLHFEQGVTVRSHLMMRGRWTVRRLAADEAKAEDPWLVMRGETHRAVLWHGPVLELGVRGVAGLGPDILARPADIDAMTRGLRKLDPDTEIGAALLQQRAVAGIGNKWRAEALFLAKVSPWLRLAYSTDERLGAVLRSAAEAMHGGSRQGWVYRRAGRPCRLRGTLIVARRQGEDARTIYWCPACQAGTEGESA